jgi:hypothetical protein
MEQSRCGQRMPTRFEPQSTALIASCQSASGSTASGAGCRCGSVGITDRTLSLIGRPLPPPLTR